MIFKSTRSNDPSTVRFPFVRPGLIQRIKSVRFSLATLVIFVLLCGTSGLLYQRWEPWGSDLIFRAWNSRTYYAEFSLDGHFIITAGQDENARVFESGSGRDVVTLTGHTGPIHHATFSPDGKRICTSAEDGTFRIWNTEDGKCLFTLLDGYSGYMTQFSPDGKRILMVGIRKCMIVDSTTGVVIASIKENYERATFARDGRFVIGVEFKGALNVYDSVTGTKVAPPLLLGEHGKFPIRALQNGNSIVISGDRKMWIYDVSAEGAMNLKSTIQCTNSFPLQVDVSPDGKRIVRTAFQGFAVYDVASGAELSTCGSTTTTESARFSPDGKRIVVAGYRGSRVVSQRRPDNVMGFFYLPELWAFVLLSAAFIRGVARDSKIEIMRAGGCFLMTVINILMWINLLRIFNWL